MSWGEVKKYKKVKLLATNSLTFGEGGPSSLILKLTRDITEV